jgi:acyl-CoA reductase-like NAD-dependent aldehyde dehydrogenase
MTATWKTAPCLALGNTAVLKMSELSPLTADRLGELALEAGIPAGVLNVVQGYGATAGDALVRHKDVRAVSFTGGTATGRRIIESAGLKKFSMELGGKSPVLIFEDADIERALDQHPGGGADQPAALGKSLRLYPPRGGRRGNPAGRRPGQTGRFEPRQLPAPDGAGGCR